MAIPIIIEKGLNALFVKSMASMFEAREKNPGLWQAALQAPSSGAYEKYGWLGAIPAVREWLGELTYKELKDYDYTIRNKKWEVSTPISQDLLDDDQVSVLSLMPSLLVSRLLAHPEKLIIELLTGGTSALAYDGIAFFSNASGARVIDNLGAGTGVTLATIEADLAAAEAAMSAFVDDQGEILNIKPNLIVCPVALLNIISRLVYSTSDPTATAEGTYNPYSGRYTVIGDARLDAVDATDWYLLATNEIIKPFVWQMRETAAPYMEKIPLADEWIYYAKYRGNAGYGLPHLAYKVVNT
jgi:phage major head subunit gpT-like protein